MSSPPAHDFATDGPESSAAADRYEAAKLYWATLSDIPALVTLYNAARDNAAESSASMMAWLGEGGGILLKHRGRDPLCAVRWREAGEGWLVDRIATRPEARGQGYGRWLLTKLEAYAIRQNIAQLRLELGATDEDVLRYYERIGYQVKDKTAQTLRLEKRVGGMWQYKR